MPCNNRGTCDDKISGSGICNCSQEFIGTGCELCASGRYGPECRGTGWAWQRHGGAVPGAVAQGAAWRAAGLTLLQPTADKATGSSRAESPVWEKVFHCTVSWGTQKL